MTKYKVTTKKLVWPSGAIIVHKGQGVYSPEGIMSETLSINIDQEIEKLLSIGWLEKIEPELKEYEIIGFRQNGAVCLLNKDNHYQWQGKSSHCTPRNYLFEALSLNKIEIYSVKRLSDGEVFEVKQKTIIKGEFNIRVIEKFVETGEDLLVNFEDGCYGPFCMVYPAPEITPLFKTEDGVQMHDGDKMWSVYIYNDEYGIIETGPMSKNFISDNSRFMYFSTLEAAEEFVTWNKPQFSLKEAINYKVDRCSHSILEQEARKRCGFTPEKP